MKGTFWEPPYGNVEVDKIPGAWVLTYWLPDHLTALRLRVRHMQIDEPDECVAEVRFKPLEEFRPIHTFFTPGCAIVLPEFPDEFLELWKDLPVLWRREFAMLALIWAKLLEITTFGEAVSVRYASEPQSSLDHYFLDAAGKTNKTM